MRDNQVPNHCLELLGVRCHSVSSNCWNDDTCISNLCRVAAIATYHAYDLSTDFFGQFEALHNVGADFFLEIAAADRKHEKGISLTQTATAKNISVGGVPPFIIDSRGELGDVICRGVALDASDLAEIVDSVTCMTSTST